MRGALLVAGTASEVGKTVVATGICRWLWRRGVAVAPFKAQNMSLNSAVTADGGEIGRAQAVQAAACGLEPETAMNPVLIKPSGEERSQVVVGGRPLAELTAGSYPQLHAALRTAALDALADLRARFDVVVCEGAGSPAEINLRAHDIANMGLASAAGLPVLLVGDIDRGGVFAALHGTLALLEPADRALVRGLLVNKFRGDAAVLAPGLRALESLTRRPVVGVLPWLDGLWLDVEDALALEAPEPEAPAHEDAIDVAVVRLRWMSNFTDVDALRAEPGVAVRFTRSPADVARADLVVLPGTKVTVEDLARLRAAGLDRALLKRAHRELPIFGICGGYQMLGRLIEDEVESRAGTVDGLGLLPVRTAFGREKVVRRSHGVAPAFGDAPVGGYEVRHGRVSRDGGEPLFAPGEGCRVGTTLGSSWHGVFEHDAFRRALLGWVAARRGRRWRAGAEAFADVRARRLERLGDLIAEHVDETALARMIDAGAR